MSEIVAPMINVGGTAWKDLLEQHIAVVQSLTAAVKAMERAAPHGRDFPVEGTYARAREQFRKRHEAIAALLRDYTALAVAIDNQKRKR